MHPSPIVSVIVPVYNEESSLPACLDALMAQDYPASQCEILVVDGGSTDRSREVAAGYCGKSPQVRCLANPARITAAGLNVGIRESRGEIIVRMDAHAIAAPDYVTRCVELLERGVAENVGGPMRPQGRTRLGRAVALATSSWFGIGGGAFHFAGREGYVDTVYLGAFRKEVFQKYGLFDEDVGPNEDDEFNFRLTRGGGKVYLSPAIRSQYLPRETLGGLWRQYYEYGFWKMRVIRKHGGIPSWRCLAPGVFVAAVLGMAIGDCGLRIVDWVLHPSLSAPSVGSFRVFSCVSWETLLFSYVLASVGFSAWTSARRGWRFLPVLPLVYAVLHGAYGVGTLAGVWHFVVRKDKRKPSPRRHEGKREEG